MKNFLLPFIAIGLVGCAGEYTFNSNLDNQLIVDYYKAGQVLLIEKNHTPPRPFDPIGVVDGESCQIGDNDAPASAANARTELRRHAADKGGNGVILNNCVTFPDSDSGCITRVLCLGQAISMESKQSYQ